MTHEQKINYMRMACNMCRFGFDNCHLDMLVSLYDLVIKMEGKTDMYSVCKVEADAKQRELERQALEKDKKKRADEEAEVK